VIAMVSLLLSQTNWAQEIRETPCTPVDVTHSGTGSSFNAHRRCATAARPCAYLSCRRGMRSLPTVFLNTANAALVGGRALVVQYQRRSCWLESPRPTAGGMPLVVAISIR